MREDCKKCGLCKNVVAKPIEGEFIELVDDSNTEEVTELADDFNNKDKLNKDNTKETQGEVIELVDDSSDEDN